MAIIVFALSLPTSTSAQSLPIARSRVVEAVNDSFLTRLFGNTHPLARAEFDQGSLADATPLRRMVLVLKRSSEQETALRQLIDRQQDKSSSSYHQWLTPDSFGAAFGLSDHDLSAVTTWLAEHGFSGLQVNAGHTLIEFSGTAGAVRSAFHTSMHRYSVQGRSHLANASDPEVPAAFAPVVAGIASLNDFPRKAANFKVGHFRRDLTTNTTSRLPGNFEALRKTESQTELQTESSQPAFTTYSGSAVSYGVTPYDFATIYNILPLWNDSSPIDGTGQTIAIVGQTDINPIDFVNFRRLFDLPLGNTATPTGTQYLNIILNGPDPGITADEGEADIDTQWSGAVAKGATIDYVVSASTEVTQGTDLSAIYIVDRDLAPVMSYSYGQCELFLGSGGNAFYNALWQQAAAQGITVLVASGDSGSADCDISGVAGASDGLAINGLASTPYNVAVGGTDFYMPTGGAAYWNSANNPVTHSSANGYIPEAAWNQSCTNGVFAISSVFSGETPEQICNSSAAISDDFSVVTGGGGGVSACTLSNGSSSSSCIGGYIKPSWQTGAGIPADGVRDVPDVSLFAGAGFFGAFYVVCQQSGNADGEPCSLTNFAGYGGTSVASPAFAGILSLVNQKTGSRQGNANYVLYSLAGQQTRSGIACNSATGTPSSGCVFNDVTTGTNAMLCLKGTPNCTVTNASDGFGVLTGFAATTNYDLATGLGSVNGANLVDNWTSSNFISTSTTLALTPVSITHGSLVEATVDVSSTSGTPTGDISINGLSATGSVNSGLLKSSVYAASVRNFPGGSYSVQAHYAGDGSHAPSDSNSIALTVAPEASTTKLQTLLASSTSGGGSSVSTASYGNTLVLRATIAGLSGQGTATGTVTFTDDGASLGGSLSPLNSSGYAEDQTALLAPGSHSLKAIYLGDSSFNASQSLPVSLTITRAPTVTTFTASSADVSTDATVVLSVHIVPQVGGYGLYPGGIITANLGTTVLGSSTLSQADGGEATISFSASQLAVGSNAITVTYSGDANYTTSVSLPFSLNLLSVGGSFILSPSTVVSSAVQGATSTAITLTATPTGGFHSTITFACTAGLPTGAICLFTPSTLAGSSTGSTTLTIAMAASGGQVSESQVLHRSTTRRWRAALTGLLLFFIPRRHRRWSVFTLLFVFSVTGIVIGCGSGMVSTVANDAPSGAYVVTVTATGGSTVQTATIKLNIQ